METVGHLIKHWRGVRRKSQLALAVQAGVSARHVGFIEVGRAAPSREMVMLLAGVLDVPLRERNALLLAAGYAPVYRETGLEAPEMEQARQAVALILEHQEPYPAFVLDRGWNSVLTNRATARLMEHLRGGVKHANVMRQVFDPEDVRPAIDNWEEVAGDLVRHLQAGVAAAPWDAEARALLEEALSYPGVPAGWHRPEPGATPPPLLTCQFRKGEQRLRFFTTLTTFGTPHDVTLQELRIECWYPADEATAAACRALAE